MKITNDELRAIMSYHRQRTAADRRIARKQPGTCTQVGYYCAALQRMAKACQSITRRHRAAPKAQP